MFEFKDKRYPLFWNTYFRKWQAQLQGRDGGKILASPGRLGDSPLRGGTNVLYLLGEWMKESRQFTGAMERMDHE
jgi:hypothetical protein